MNNATTYRENTIINEPSQQRNESETSTTTTSEEEDSDTSTTTSETWRTNYQLRSSRLWSLSIKSAFGDDPNEGVRDPRNIPNHNRHALGRNPICGTSESETTDRDAIRQNSGLVRFVQDLQLQPGNHQQLTNLNSWLLHSSHRSRCKSRLPRNGRTIQNQGTITSARGQDQLTLYEVNNTPGSEQAKRVVILRLRERRGLQNNCRKYLCVPERSACRNIGDDLFDTEDKLQHHLQGSEPRGTGTNSDDALHHSTARISPQRPQLLIGTTRINTNSIRQPALHRSCFNTRRRQLAGRPPRDIQSGIPLHKPPIEWRTFRTSLDVQDRRRRTTNKEHVNNSPSNNYTWPGTPTLGNVRHTRNGIDQYYSRVAILTAGTGVYVTQDGRAYSAVEYDDQHLTATTRSIVTNTDKEPLTVQTHNGSNELKVSVNNGNISVTGHVGVSNHLLIPLEVIGV